MKFLLLSLILVSCGSEAKFHSVYVYDTPQEKERDIYSCEHTKEGAYVCTKINPSQCLDKK